MSLRQIPTDSDKYLENMWLKNNPGKVGGFVQYVNIFNCLSGSIYEKQLK